jgi:hypothetical protein
LSAFNAHGVKYLIVGGYAVSFHAQPRATKDIDLFIKANAKAAYAALAACGGALEGIREEDFAEAGNFIRFGREPRAVDILPAIDGVEFNDAWDRRVSGVIDPESGLTAFFISASDLVAAKIAAGRPQDIADVAAIRKALEE